jgi:phosphohistidine phosphatase
MAVLDFAIDRWRDLAGSDAESGHLRRFIRPRDLDPALGPERG